MFETETKQLSAPFASAFCQNLTVRSANLASYLLTTRTSRFLPVPAPARATVKRVTKKQKGKFFATLQQNELNSDVARFTTHVRTCLATNMTPSIFFVMINRATSLFNSFEATWQNKFHVLCCPFYCT